MNTREEELIPLNRIGRRVCAPDPPHISTVTRWVLHGVGNPPVKLATVKVGGRRYTTQSAIDAFIAATSAQQTATAPTDRRAAVAKAEHELTADGITD